MQINRSISYTRSWKSTVLIGLILSAVFCFVLIFLQPFDTYDVDMPYKNLKLLGYALPIMVYVLGIHFIENAWYNKQQKWMLWNEVLIMVIGLFAMTLLSFIYLNNVVNPTALPWSEYFSWMRFYGLPFAPILLILWAYLRFRFSRVELNEVSSNTNQRYTIVGDNANETHEVVWKDFLLAKAQSNYVEILTIDPSSKSNQKVLIRSSLSKLIPQIPEAVQVHRSYLINTTHLTKLEGNSRKGCCYLQGLDEPIPVSPKHFKALREWLQNRPQ